MIYWAPLLHFYQPPTQLHGVLRKVVDESYRPLIELFRSLPYSKATVNINAVLTEMLYDHGFNDVLQGLCDLAARGQVEFTGSAKYHPILPLIPREEIERQISLNAIVNRRFLKNEYNPQGFFPPEMCYSEDILQPVIAAGHRWIVLSGIACPVEWPMNIIHEISTDGNSIAVLFRDNILSDKISFQNIDAEGFISHLMDMRGWASDDIYVITAMDAETFGHHIQDWEKLFLSEVYEALNPETADRYAAVSPTQPSTDTSASPEHRNIIAQQHQSLLQSREAAEGKDIEIVTISQLLDIFPRGSVIEPVPSSWSTSKEDIEAGNPYPLWKDRNNAIHRLQWWHLQIALEMVNKAVSVAHSEPVKRYSDIARALMDTSLHSCQFWWANHKPMWDINLIDRGLEQQREVIVNAYKAISISDCSGEEKTEYYYRVVAARDIRNKVTDKIFMTPE